MEENDENLLPNSESEHSLNKEVLLLEVIKMRNLHELRLLGLSDGGLLASRSLCWSLLLLETPPPLPSSFPQEIHHQQAADNFKQIDLDVARCSFSSREDADALRLVLKSVLYQFFRTFPTFHYFQGLHDVAAAILLVYSSPSSSWLDNPVDMTVQILHVLCTRLIFADFVRFPEFRTLDYLLNAVHTLLSQVDLELATRLQEFPHWGVSMLLTGFAHDVSHEASKLRLMDAIVSSPAYFPVYLLASLALGAREEVLSDEDFCQHAVLRTRARNIATVRQADQLVRTARSLCLLNPPDILFAECSTPAFRQLSIVFVETELWTPPPPPPKSSSSSSWWWKTATALAALTLAIVMAQQQYTTIQQHVNKL